MLFTDRNAVNLQTISNKTELPCLLCGRSITCVISGMLGLARSLALWVSWRHRALTVYGRHLDGLWFDVVEELVIL